MLIRKDQMAAFNQYMRGRFEEHMVGHLHTYYAEACHALGEVKIREMIRHGIARAKIYGITAETDVSRYINMMFVFGREFDIEPNYKVFRQILDETGYKSGGEKMDALYDAANKQLP